MHLKWILLISCIILSNYAIAARNKVSNSRIKATTSFKSPKLARNVRPITSQASPPRNPPPIQKSLYKPMMATAPQLPSEKQIFRATAPPRGPPSPPMPPPGLNLRETRTRPFGQKPAVSSLPTGQLARGSQGQTLVKRINSTSLANSNRLSSGFGSTSNRNNTFKANNVLGQSPANNQRNRNTFNSTSSSQNFSKNFTGNGFSNGMTRNSTGSPMNLGGGRQNMTQLTKINQTQNASGFNRGPAFVPAVMLKPTKTNNTRNATHNSNGFNGNASSHIMPIAKTTSSNNLFVGNNNNNNNNQNSPPPFNDNNNWNTGFDNGVNNTPEKAKKSGLQEAAKTALKEVVKKFASKRNDAPKKVTHSLANTMNGRSWNENQEDYVWKSSFEESPSKPPMKILRNQIIIIVTCVLIVLVAIGMIVYFCNRNNNSVTLQ